ncbi:carboxypeptidase regulatory-like domain-containing protein [Fibrobacter sp. UWP2]|uniref:carboxypeptidase regulatory-like domain-containing protein n=1 Tax=Fibrobacter sp. UWP2 TaxID=1896216 RepID=UPI0009231827|nr:carboxypeptidase regulatory-like domain-containing protein [Fibrobacter sp. UWP2]SHI54032.1 Por secretion system C-terminal sorting domain-containing protein [Fibrobacter sp. UWP2]
MKDLRLSSFLGVLCATFATSTFAYDVSGTVSDESGNPVSGANVSLIKEAKSTTTDASGKFLIHEDEQQQALRQTFNYNNAATAHVKVFDLMGNQVVNKYFPNATNLNMSKELKGQGTYFAQVTIGSATQTVKFNTNDKSINLASTGAVQGLLAKAAAAGEALQIIADGFDTLSIPLGTLDTTVNVKLTKTAPAEEQFKFGYALKNEPRPSKGCGKTSTLQKTRSVENGDRFEMRVGSENREYFITLPKNYDNNKPHKVLFAMHCMGSNAEDFVHHSPDQDHPSPYYGQQKLDTEGNYIFVAPRGDTDGMPWSMNSDKDHKFIDQLITTINENYCVDTSRIFMTGFSFGAMVTNSMAQDMQHRLRAVAVYATADFNIYLPQNKGKPIAWMAVHGKNDGTCPYDRAKNSALKRILKNNGKADANGNFTDASAETPKEVGGSGHLCYDFTTVDERFPVKWCSWNGQHQWTAYDNGNWQNTWVPQEVHKFFEQF